MSGDPYVENASRAMTAPALRAARPKVPDLLYADASGLPDGGVYTADELDDEHVGVLIAEYVFRRFVRVKAPPPRVFEIVDAN